MLERGYSPTSLEKAAQTMLDELGLKYTPQLATRTGFVIDFAIFSEGRKIALEVDGEMWHSSKKARKRDAFKDYQLKREGWEVLRVREENLMNLGLILVAWPLEARRKEGSLQR